MNKNNVDLFEFGPFACTWKLVAGMALVAKQIAIIMPYFAYEMESKRMETS